MHRFAKRGDTRRMQIHQAHVGKTQDIRAATELLVCIAVACVRQHAEHHAHLRGHFAQSAVARAARAYLHKFRIQVVTQ